MKNNVKNQDILALAKELNTDFNEQQEIFKSLAVLCRHTITPYCKNELIYGPAQVYGGQTEITPDHFIYSDEYGGHCNTPNFNEFYQVVLDHLDKYLKLDNYIEEQEITE